MGDHFNLDTSPASVHRWVQEYSQQASEIAGDFPVQTGDERVAEDVAVKEGGEQYWLFNFMDADSRFVLAAYLSPERTRRRHKPGWDWRGTGRRTRRRRSRPMACVHTRKPCAGHSRRIPSSTW